MKNRCLGIFILSSFFLGAGFGLAQTPSTIDNSIQRLATDKNFVEVSRFAGVTVHLMYATTDNFTGTNLYGNFRSCYLHVIAAEKLKKACALLQAAHPGYRFIIFDALRPRSVQWKLWAKVKGTAQQKYVADPAKGSNHNYGLAVDIGLLDEKGNLVDMGAPFDGFTPLSEPQLEDRFLKEGKLTREQLDHRLILRRAMEGAGFIQLRAEWWHYDAMTLREIKDRKIQVVE